ncbi:hypothetical protein ACFW04_007973 [Cataglyphis niger]
MEIMFLVIVFTAIVTGAQSRSVAPSNVGDTGDEIPVNMPVNMEQLKELITSYEKNVAKLINFITVKISRDKDNTKREIQFLDQLSLLVDELTREQLKMRSIYAKLNNNTNFILQAPNNKATIMSVNNVKDLIDYMKEIDIVYQNGDVTDEHIRIKRAAEEYNKTISFTMLEEIINTLIDIQHHLTEIQKCLDKICKKHHLTSTIPSEEISNDDVLNQAKKI